MLVLILYFMTAQVEWDLNSDTLVLAEKDAPFSQGSGLLSQRLRFNIDWDLKQNWSFEAAYDQVFITRRNLVWPPADVHLRTDNLNSPISQRQNSIWLQQIDRLAIHKEWESAEVILGRQAVGFGNGRFFNPSDIFAPITPYSLNTEYKAGIDGVRVIWRLSENSDMEVLSFLDESNNHLSLLKFSTHIIGIDLAGYAGDSYGELTLGWDLAWTGDTSVWYTEGIFRKGVNRKSPLRLMAGVQRRIRDNLDILAEYQYHSKGLNDFKALPNLTHIKEIAYGELFYMGRQQAALFLQFEFHPLFKGTLQMIHDMSGNSQWVLLSFDWDKNENTNLRFGVLGSNGDELSEFGWYSNSIFCEFKLVL